MLNLKYLVDLLNTINLGVILCMWFNLLWKWWFKAIRQQEEPDQSLTPIYFFVYHYVSRGYSYYIVDIYSVDSPRHIHCASTHIFRVSFFWVKNSFFFFVFVEQPKSVNFHLDEILWKVLCLDSLMERLTDGLMSAFPLIKLTAMKCFHLNI